MEKGGGINMRIPALTESSFRIMYVKIWNADFLNTEADRQQVLALAVLSFFEQEVENIVNNEE